LLGHIGGLGSRSRCGFGTVALQPWEWADKSTIELPIAHSADSPEKWLEQFQNGLNIIKDWFKGKMVVDHTVFGRNTKFYLLNGFAIETREGKPFEP
jgi:CRISPR-associated protein Cmr1